MPNRTRAAGPKTVFIVRPFGTKEGIDFEAIEDALIDPVLKELGFLGGTTGEFAHAGNIRTDMMQELLLADIVIADVSIHNANVYYELGVRHALRDRATVLIRCDSAPVPFDLKTDRYLEYKKDDPKAAVTALKAAIEATLARNGVDSPVFQLLPEVRPHDVSQLIPVPRAFREAVSIARESKDPGQLVLLADEVRARAWRIAAWTLVADALFNLKVNKAAQRAYDDIRQEKPDDPEANLKLATVYQRMSNLPLSNAALARIKEDSAAGIRREAMALLGRNKKTQWLSTWLPKSDVVGRQRVALTSPLLLASRDAYRKGFVIDPSSYYAGLNALAMYSIQHELAMAQPQTWVDSHEDEQEAERELNGLKKNRERLVDAVAFALESAEEADETKNDPWFAVSKADHLLLAGASAKRVRVAYEGARQLLHANDFQVDAAARQLTLYRELGLFSERVDAGLEALECAAGVTLEDKPSPPGLVLVGTGHRIDAPGEPRRFPADAASEERARKRIRDAVESAMKNVSGPVKGMAALASGTDILFHEVCAELGVRTEILLPIPEDAFKAQSVVAAGSDWIRRFDELRARGPVRILSNESTLPPWIKDAKYDVFQRGNLWLLDSAFAVANANVTFIALWDQDKAAGSGGTGDMVNAARERGADVRMIDTKELFGAPSA